MSTLMSLLPSYAEYLRSEARRATSTRYTYMCGVRAFVRSLPPGALAEDLTTEAVLRYISDVALTHRPRTTRHKLFAIRSFCRFLVERGLLGANVAAAVPAPKLDPAIREVATDAEVGELVDACARIGSPQRQALARAVVLTLVHGGIRRNAVLNVHLEDVNVAEGSIFIRREKGGKSWSIYPNAQCMEAISVYLKLRPADTQHPYLFSKDRTRRFADQSLRVLLRDLFQIMGRPGCTNLLPHSIRHNYATRMYRNGANLEDIRVALGHTSIVTTAIYLHANEERLRQISSLSALSCTEAAPAPPAERSGARSASTLSEHEARPQPQKPSRSRRIDLRAKRLPR